MEPHHDQLLKDIDNEPFKPLVVMELAADLPTITTQWIMNCIKDSKRAPGLLRVRQVTMDKKEILFIAAGTKQLLIAAELMELKKLYSDGMMRELTLSDLEEYENSEDLDNFLTTSEKQQVILHELEWIRASESDKNVPGFPNEELYRGEAVIPRCQREHHILSLFPLHDKEQLKRLGSIWYKDFFGVQPLDEIRRYFGETIAMYFAFLGIYTFALVPPACIGLFSIILGMADTNTGFFFCVFNLVWATLFLEGWKRYCSTLAFQWGTIDSEHFEEARAEYYGVVGTNKITGRLEPKYPKWKKKVKFYFGTVPFVVFCLFLAFLTMLGYFWLQFHADDFNAARGGGILGSVVVLLPSVLYAILISIMNAIYRTLAKLLNDWENHRLQSAYDNHLVFKLVLFDFSNCFMSLFYVAFYLQDMKLLRSHLGTLLVIQQVIGQVQEAVLPYLMYKNRKRKVTAEHKQVAEDGTLESAADSSVSEEYKLQADIELHKEIYPGMLDDYLEMFLQFGYVFLFSAVFPSAAIWALINNITEIRTDGFKLCRIFQRPFARPSSGIGAWEVAFSCMSVMAVVTNCALVALQPHVKEHTSAYGDVSVLIFFVIMEHVILATKALVAFIIPDKPEWVETAQAQLQYQSKAAWRKERQKSSTNLLEVKHLKTDLVDVETIASRNNSDPISDAITPMDDNLQVSEQTPKFDNCSQSSQNTSQ